MPWFRVTERSIGVSETLFSGGWRDHDKVRAMAMEHEKFARLRGRVFVNLEVVRIKEKHHDEVK